MSVHRVYTFEEVARVAGEAGIEVLPPKQAKSENRVDTSKLRAAIEAKQKAKRRKATTAEPAAPELRKIVHYVRGGGLEELNLRTGEWLERDRKYWDFQSRQATLAQVLEVRDVEGPTVIDHSTHGRIVTRGCAICGHRDVVRPPNPIKIGKLRGTLCPTCHSQWQEMTLSQRKDLDRFVTKRLRESGYIDPSVPLIEVIEQSPTHRSEVPLVVVGWRKYLWASRVLNSADPEKQEPPSQPFGFLSGPLSFAESVGAESETGKT